MSKMSPEERAATLRQKADDLLRKLAIRNSPFLSEIASMERRLAARVASDQEAAPYASELLTARDMLREILDNVEVPRG